MTSIHLPFVSARSFECIVQTRTQNQDDEQIGNKIKYSSLCSCLLKAPNDGDVSFYSIDADDGGSDANKDGAVKLIVFDVENSS